MYRSISTSFTLHTPFTGKVNNTASKVQLAIRALRSYINAVEQKDHTWETACHLSALVLIAGLVPAANVLAPLIIWIIRKNQSPGTDRHGRAVLNFQLAMTLYFSILFFLSKINGLAVPAGICLRAWAYINIYLILRGGYKAAKGEAFQYPFSIRFFSTIITDQPDELEIAKKRYENTLEALRSEGGKDNKIAALKAGREYADLARRKAGQGGRAIFDEAVLQNDLSAYG